MDFLKGFLSFGRRKRWEEYFNEGVVVDSLLAPISKKDKRANKEKSDEHNFDGDALNTSNVDDNQYEEEGDIHYDEEWGVSLEGLPEGLPIGKFLDRAEAIDHLANQMLKSDPNHCMHCNTNLKNAQEERRSCSCCGIVICGVCCSKLVWEVYSKMVVKVCPHCYRESSRIRHHINLNETVESNLRKEKKKFVNLADKKEPLPDSKKKKKVVEPEATEETTEEMTTETTEPPLMSLDLDLSKIDNGPTERDSLYDRPFFTPRTSEIGEFSPSELLSNEYVGLLARAQRPAAGATTWHFSNYTLL